MKRREIFKYNGEIVWYLSVVQGPVDLDSAYYKDHRVPHGDIHS